MCSQFFIQWRAMVEPTSEDISSAGEIRPKTVRLADYACPDYLVDTVDLIFELAETTTRVKSRLCVRRNPLATNRTRLLQLNGEAISLVSLALDAELLAPDRYDLSPTALTIEGVPDVFNLDVETRIEPYNNTELSGLYIFDGTFCTHCEAEGFRRITYFPDRPDVMARYTTTIFGDKSRFPVLLSNGNPVDRGECCDGRHWVKWEDPFPKPSYLFALVAGDLVAHRDNFITHSGRDVALAIWVRRGEDDRCGHAMAALKAAMKWDEAVYGLEYDLDVFNIVAMAHFNVGGMENKGLNIFPAENVLARPESATDADYRAIETAIAHEYFHNWTGNRIACRDWFQLSLKEGLTVFRDQEFACDQGGRAGKRIQQARSLRAAQFSEDASSMTHAVRPESYTEIESLYTPTVYFKGAEVVRMIYHLAGDDTFHRGICLFIQRHDGHAVTIEDFVRAVEDAGGLSLGQFMRWYDRSGTPELMVSEAYDPSACTFILTIEQVTPTNAADQIQGPLVIPLAMGLLDPSGTELATRLEGDLEPHYGTRILIVTERRQSFRFLDVPRPPVPSLLRNFSAPVNIKGRSMDQLRFCARRDTDRFGRWDAGQQVTTHVLLELVGAFRRGEALVLDEDFARDFMAPLVEGPADPTLTAEMLGMPSEALLADQMAVVDVEAVHAARSFLRGELGRRYRAEFLAAYATFDDPESRFVDDIAASRRALKNVCLDLLAAAPDDETIDLARRQLERRRNMTDVMAALTILSELVWSERETMLSEFYETWKSEAPVIDKWFAIQAVTFRPGTLEAVKALTRHPAFDLRNPSRVRSLVGAFAAGNPLHFHAADGSGYNFLADWVIALDAVNTKVAAHLLGPLSVWARHDDRRKVMMLAALERILAKPALSKGVHAIARTSLGTIRTSAPVCRDRVA
jgi:aminopeptidase N